MKTQDAETQDTRLAEWPAVPNEAREVLVVRGTAAEVLAKLAALRTEAYEGRVEELVELKTREVRR